MLQPKSKPLSKSVQYRAAALTPVACVLFTIAAAVPNVGSASDGRLKNGDGLCLDAGKSEATTNGGKVQVYSCTGGSNQQWAFVDGRLKNGDGLCLDAHKPEATTNGGKVQVYSCTGGSNQQWAFVDGRLKNGDGLCLDAHKPEATTNGGKVQVYSCTGGSNQQWSL